MKMRLPSFLAGMLTMALAASLGVGALAASGAFTITVNPVSVQVNGQTFHPKDANGKDVPVFNYDGTTYAPLRALAEAYGLTVGWDQDAQMATVGETSAPPDAPLPTDYSDWSEEDEAAYQEFKGLWVIEKGVSNIAATSDLVIWRADYNGDLNYNAHGSVGLHAELKKTGKKTIAQYVLRMAKAIQEQYPKDNLYFELYGKDVIDGDTRYSPICRTSFLVDGKEDVVGFIDF